jgi:hypothetical protein
VVAQERLLPPYHRDAPGDSGLDWQV